jgi:hypothetical protein
MKPGTIVQNMMLLSSLHSLWPVRSVPPLVPYAALAKALHLVQELWGETDTAPSPPELHLANGFSPFQPIHVARTFVFKDISVFCFLLSAFCFLLSLHFWHACFDLSIIFCMAFPGVW